MQTSPAEAEALQVDPGARRIGGGDLLIALAFVIALTAPVVMRMLMAPPAQAVAARSGHVLDLRDPALMIIDASPALWREAELSTLPPLEYDPRAAAAPPPFDSAAISAPMRAPYPWRKPALRRAQMDMATPAPPPDPLAQIEETALAPIFTQERRGVGASGLILKAAAEESEPLRIADIFSEPTPSPAIPVNAPFIIKESVQAAPIAQAAPVAEAAPIAKVAPIAQAAPVAIEVAPVAQADPEPALEPIPAPVVAQAVPAPIETSRQAEAPPAPRLSAQPEISPPLNAPRIALVLGAIGLDERASRHAIDNLPPQITLAIAPIARNAERYAKGARMRGHAVLVEMPMEPVNYPQTDPGPLTLLTSDSAEANIDRIARTLEKAPGAMGVSTYLGARFSADERALAPVLANLKARGLLLFENSPAAMSRIRQSAAQINLPYRKGAFVIDEERSEPAIRAALDRLERRARAHGSAVGVGAGHPETIAAVEAWAREAAARGVRLVSLEEL